MPQLIGAGKYGFAFRHDVLCLQGAQLCFVRRVGKVRLVVEGYRPRVTTAKSL